MVRFLLKISLLFTVVLAVDWLAGTYLKRGLDRYFGFDKKAEILLVGHSYTMLGIDVGLLEESLAVPIAKYAVNGANVFDRLAMLRQYFTEHPETVKVVVYDVNDRLFADAGLSANSYRLFYPYIDNSEMQVFLQEHAGSTGEFALRRIFRSLRFNTTDLNLAIRGNFGILESFKSGRVDIVQLQQEIEQGRRPGVTVESAQLRVFEKSIAFVRSQGAVMVLCYIPTVDLLSRMDWESHERVVSMFGRYAEADPGVFFLNYQQKYGSRHELFWDPVHLNRDGQKVITRELGEFLAERATATQSHSALHSSVHF